MSLLNMSFSAAVLILAIVIIRALLLHRLPKKTFLILWGMALCRLLIPFEFSSRFSIYSAIAMLTSRFYEADLSMAEVPSASDRSIAANLVTLPGTTSASISPILIIWFIGLVGCALFFLLTHLRCRKEYKTALPVDNEFVKHWQHKNPMWRKIQIRQSDIIFAPLTYGIFRPVVLLPTQTDWTDEIRLRYIFTHEFVHIRRFDTLTKLVMATALCVHWFNPLVWVMYILANRDIELSNDETVVKTIGGDIRSSYALTLIALEETKGRCVFPLLNFFSNNAIVERITAIMKIKKYTIPVVVVAILLVAGVAVAFATSNAAYDNNDASIYEDEEKNKGGDISNVERTVATSELYSEQDINEAMDIVVNYFQSDFEGCTLTDLWYDENVCVSQSDEWAKQYDADESIVLLSNFDVDSAGGDGSMEPNSTYSDWLWILVRNEGSDWELKTWGY